MSQRSHRDPQWSRAHFPQFAHSADSPFRLRYIRHRSAFVISVCDDGEWRRKTRRGEILGGMVRTMHGRRSIVSRMALGRAALLLSAPRGSSNRIVIPRLSLACVYLSSLAGQLGSRFRAASTGCVFLPPLRWSFPIAIDRWRFIDTSSTALFSRIFFFFSDFFGLSSSSVRIVPDRARHMRTDARRRR